MHSKSIKLASANSRVAGLTLHVESFQTSVRDYSMVENAFKIINKKFNRFFLNCTFMQLQIALIVEGRSNIGGESVCMRVYQLFYEKIYYELIK